jgi:hypothetical protein
MADALQSLLEYCKANGRVCPQPIKWNDLYSLLPNRRQVGAGFEPAAPLILAGWWASDDQQKKERLADHLKWAEKHGALDRADKYLRSLSEAEWHHE